MSSCFVMAVMPVFIDMAVLFHDPAAIISTRVIAGRGYVVVAGNPGRSMSFVDPTDNALLMEMLPFENTAEAERWIDQDVKQRRHAS